MKRNSAPLEKKQHEWTYFSQIILKDVFDYLLQIGTYQIYISLYMLTELTELKAILWVELFSTFVMGVHTFRIINTTEGLIKRYTL